MRIYHSLLDFQLKIFSKYSLVIIGICWSLHFFFVLILLILSPFLSLCVDVYVCVHGGHLSGDE